MPTLVDEEMPDAEQPAAAEDAAAATTDDAGASAKEAPKDAASKKPEPSNTATASAVPSTTVSASGGKSLGKGGGKRRTASPTVNSNDHGSAPASASASSSASQAMAAANLAAAVQMAASLQLNGLLSLLTQSSTPGVSASAADPTVLQASSLSASLSSSTTSWQVPTPEQVRQAALKAVQEGPPFVHLSKTDSAPQLKILESDRLTLKGGMRGYRMSRATHGVSQGYYYFEVLVLDPPSIHEIVASLPANARLGSSLQRQIQQALEYDKQYPEKAKGDAAVDAKMEAATAEASDENNDNKPGRKRKAETDLQDAESTTKKSKNQLQRPQVGGHLRIGWSMRTGDLQAPVGYDKWSYGFRNLAGSKIHESRREDAWGGEAWGPGDVVGCAIFMEGSSTGTPTASGNNTSPNPNSSPGTPNANANSNNNNHIRFFKNGAPMGQFVIAKGKREGGAAFENIQPGTYYPAISSYLGGSVRVNFGPHFICPPRRLPHGMSGKLQPVSSLQAAPLPKEELLARLKKKNIFSKVAKEKESPEAKFAAFKEAILAESEVLQEAYQQHRRKHLQQVLQARKARNLNAADLQQELDELDGKGNEAEADGTEKDSAMSNDPTDEKDKMDGDEEKMEGTTEKAET